MSRTPIADFVRDYAESGTARMHMPGHKGVGDIEAYDITEIKGADSLYDADGIIAKSEGYASEIFGARTLYSAEGSSLAIRGMLHLAMIEAKKRNKKPLILAGRNAHKVFISTAALLGFDVEWIISGDSYLSCPITADILKKMLGGMSEKPTAVYITSPDYLGNIADIKAISEVCREEGMLLLVDNAHGAYLKFLPESLHPIDLGADMCADSAHKTLPVLTGGAYLHLSRELDAELTSLAKNAMAMFGSTSPSYLILTSLDLANPYLLSDFRKDLSTVVSKVSEIKKTLSAFGYKLVGTEPMKITVSALSVGYDGCELAEHLRGCGIEPEFADRDYLTLMPSVGSIDSFDLLLSSLIGIERREPITSGQPSLIPAERAMSIREAALSPSISLPLDECVGRVLAVADVSCPPAVPILVPGEKISEGHLEIFRYYNKNTLRVVV